MGAAIVALIVLSANESLMASQVPALITIAAGAVFFVVFGIRNKKAVKDFIAAAHAEKMAQTAPGAAVGAGSGSSLS